MSDNTTPHATPPAHDENQLIAERREKLKALRAEFARKSAEQAAAIDDLKAGVMRASHAVQQLLTLARLEQEVPADAQGSVFDVVAAGLGHQVVIADRSASAVRAAHHRYPGLRAVGAAADALPFAPCRFDQVLVAQGMHLLPPGLRRKHGPAMEALFARELELEHPTRPERLTFTAPLPAGWPWPGADTADAPLWNWDDYGIGKDSVQYSVAVFSMSNITPEHWDC